MMKGSGYKILKNQEIIASYGSDESENENNISNKYLREIQDPLESSNNSSKTRKNRITIKLFYIILIILIFFSLILLCYFIYSYHNNLKSNLVEHKRSVPIRNIFNSIDSSIDPCEDFYKYSCGNWIKSSISISHNQSRWTTFDSLTYENQLVIKEELENRSTEKNINLIDAEIKAILFYKSCMARYVNWTNSEHNQETVSKNWLFETAKKFLINENKSLVFNRNFESILYDAHIEYAFDVYFKIDVSNYQDNIVVSTFKKKQKKYKQMIF